MMRSMPPDSGNGREDAVRVLKQHVAAAPTMEPLESRLLLSAAGFLQGTAFIDTDNNAQLDPKEEYLAGAQIDLKSLGPDNILGTGDDGPGASQITGADGSYLFSNIPPGNYLLTETPPPGYVNIGAQALSQLNPASVVDSHTIQVQVVDPSNMTVTFDGTYPTAEFFTRNKWEYYNMTLFGVAGKNTVGQFPITVTPPGAPQGQFLTLCSDLSTSLSDAVNQFHVVPETVPASPALASSAGLIGYLYNHYGLTDIASKADAIGLQFAIWELEYDDHGADGTVTAADFSSGNFQVNSPVSGYTSAAEMSAAIDRAVTFVNASKGNSERVTFLNATGVISAGQQGMLASGSLNFANIPGQQPRASLGDRLWVDTNGDGVQNDGATGISGQLVTLIGGGADGVIGTGSDDTSATTTTGTDGFYQFTGLTPGVEYQVQFSKPTGTVFTNKDASGNTLDATDSDADLVTGKTQIVTLASGENNPTIDAGVVNPTPGIEIIKDVVGTAIVAPNTPVTFTYSVRNTGGVALSSLVVTDDNATPDFAEDDFNPTPVLSGGFNIGDINQNNLLDTTEIWKYSATVIPPVVMTVTPVVGGPTYSSGTLSYETLANGDIRIYYRQDANFNDNTYGTGSDSGWTSRGKTHKFGDLVGSDKAGFLLKYSDGTVLAQFYQDYITLGGTNTEGYAAWSGYQSLGFSGGDGSWVAGSTTAKTTWLSDFDSTLETDLNQSGTANNGVAYKAMTVNSPVGDANWDVVDGYAFTISSAAFSGGKTFGGVTIFDQHNSPPKIGSSNSLIPTVVGGDLTNTAVVTATLGSDTVVALDDATVHVGPQTPEPGNVTAGTPVVSGKVLSLTLTNTGGSSVNLTSILADWATKNGKLMDVKIRGTKIYDVDTRAPEANITSFLGSANLRILGAGTSITLVFDFEKNADTVLSNYDFTFGFSDGSTLVV